MCAAGNGFSTFFDSLACPGGKTARACVRFSRKKVFFRCFSPQNMVCCGYSAGPSLFLTPKHDQRRSTLMKRTRTLCAALALTAAAALTACSMPGGSGSAADSSAPDSSAADSSAAEAPAESDPGETISSEDGYGEGRLGDTMQTYFF